MPLRKKLLPTPTGVSTSGTATFDLTIGKRYHVITLELGDTNGITLASGNLIGEIRLKLNGKVQRTFTGIELNALNLSQGTKYGARTSGTAGTAGYRTYLPIFLAELWRILPSEQAASAWNIHPQDVQSFQIEVDFKAVTAPILTGFYEWEPLTGRLGFISKWIRQTFAAVGTYNDFTTIPRRDFIQAIYMFPTVETTPKYVNKAQFRADADEYQDLLTTLENQVVLLWRDMNPDVAAVPRFDLIIDYNDPTNMWLQADGLGELTLHVEYNAAAAGNLVCIIQRSGPPE